MEKVSKDNKVIYKGETCTFTWSAGKGWKEPKDGLSLVVDEETGIEYDLTDYIEDEIWIIINKKGVDICCYKSECKII